MVDYNIISKRIFKRVKAFKVGGLTDYSDHCPLSLLLDIHIPSPAENQPCRVHRPPAKFIWDVNSNEMFLGALSSDDNIYSCESYMVREFETNSAGVDTAVDVMNNLIIKVSKGCIKRKQVKISKHKRCNKKFKHNETCSNIRSQLHYVKTLKERYPNNKDIREQYYGIKRIFEKEIKKHKTKVKGELLDKMNSFHDKDTKKYWDIFNELRNVKSNATDCPISADDWVNHYKDLYYKSPDLDCDIKDDLKNVVYGTLPNKNFK